MLLFFLCCRARLDDESWLGGACLLDFLHDKGWSPSVFSLAHTHSFLGTIALSWVGLALLPFSFFLLYRHCSFSPPGNDAHTTTRAVAPAFYPPPTASLCREGVVGRQILRTAHKGDIPQSKHKTHKTLHCSSCCCIHTHIRGFVSVIPLPRFSPAHRLLPYVEAEPRPRSAL